MPGLAGLVFGNGTSAGFDTISFSDSGNVALTANVTNGTATARALLSDLTGSLGVLVRSGDPVPDGNGSFDLLARPFMNAGGEIAFLASTTPSPRLRHLRPTVTATTSTTASARSRGPLRRPSRFSGDTAFAVSTIGLARALIRGIPREWRTRVWR